MTTPTPPLSPAAQADGLHGKYIVHKADGQPVEYPCFVLRINGTDRAAAIAALEAYAVATRNWELKTDLLALAAELRQEGRP